MKKLIPLILILVFFSTPLLASNGQFTAIDIGSCADFVNSYEYFNNNLIGKGIDSENTQLYAKDYKFTGYIEGFITGTNKDKARIVSSNTASWRMFIYNYCKKKPLDSLIQALIELDKELDK